jgi:hypothetical protein
MKAEAEQEKEDDDYEVAVGSGALRTGLLWALYSYRQLLRNVSTDQTTRCHNS